MLSFKFSPNRQERQTTHNRAVAAAFAAGLGSDREPLICYVGWRWQIRQLLPGRQGSRRAHTTIANVIPLRHFNTAMWTVFNPHTTGSGFQWSDIGFIAMWGLVGLVIAIRFFRWKPTGD